MFPCLSQTRRSFCIASAASLISLRSGGQSRSQTHPDVAAIDHDRVLAAASTALTQPVSPITAVPAPRSPGTAHDYYSEPEEFYADPASPSAPWLPRNDAPTSLSSPNPAAFTAHRDAVFTLGITVAALTAAFAITSDTRYAARAAEHLRSWFIAPASRMTPDLRFGQRIPNTPAGRPEGILETVPLAEVARSILFLANSGALTSDDLSGLHAWFAAYAQWLNDSRLGGLARDRKDHHASSWLFQSAAYADANVSGLTSDSAALNTLRHTFHTVTLRAQMNALGIFPHEVSTSAPYRNSLFNLDLLTLACELLTTRFDNPWEYELQDGPGLRNAIARHFAFMAAPATWPYPADRDHFKLLPGRRISLLLAGRAYNRPEYVDLWRTLVPLPQTSPPALLRTFPITQPLLWFTRPKPRIPSAE